ncbi:hypothetical protein A5782_23460 [Mycobacterium sp. 852002-40037_SCH5390672]|nr:hypothetical protein A5782_23460 [Mycobacterium sp. 852002-40037_SCH5390672]
MNETTTEQLGMRPELISLDSAACQRVQEQIAAKGGHCEACGTTDFAVGAAMIMGFLFLDEDADAYMVALTCRNPDCPKPRTGIRLCGKDFLSEEQRASAIALRSSIA